ncbi:MAG: methyltransferase domain-containing protein, partial [Chloroflexi bacterium]|nr:methyltransferase domain-containing protein [Chloroflexota bacterium]
MDARRTRKYIHDVLDAHTTHGVHYALTLLTRELANARRHRASARQAARFLQGALLELNLGCGPNPKAGWINVDLFDDHADLHLDLRERWPFPDRSVSHIYSEHVFEHFDFHVEVPYFLAESWRVLCAGGIFDVGVPDTQWTLHAYGHPESDYWDFARSGVHADWCETQLDHINYHFRQDGEHKYAWDTETLVRTLHKAGF